MGKKPNNTSKLTNRKELYCSGCDSDKPTKDFYKSNGTTDSGYIPYCKDCCYKYSLDNNNNFNIEKFKEMLQKIDKPFIYNIWNTNESKIGVPNENGTIRCKTLKSAIGYYIKDVSMKQYRDFKYKDSIFEPSDNKNDLNSDNNENYIENKMNLSIQEKNRLIDKWGLGYSDEEYYSFEKKYDLLKENYPQRTAMHTEALLTYIRYRVKEELATAKGDVAEAQKWGQLADKASERAKINPSQLSKADLSGGLNGFSELSRAVEQAVDAISILPKFKERPQDKVDFTLWCYINYIRRMKNLPDVEYKEIWHFYEERKEEYKRNDKEREFKFEDEE